MISAGTRIAGVIGSPVLHSLSPLLMNSWIEAADIDAAYIALSANPEFSANDFRSLAQCGLSGVNVTHPFKMLAAEVSDTLTETARLAGAANLLRFEAGRIHGDNTDIVGIDYALRQCGVTFEGMTVLVLGAGGAARAACVAADLGSARDVIVSNRTRSRAESLKERYKLVSVCDWGDRRLAAARADLIINATSLGLDGNSDPGIDWIACKPESVVFDMIYSPQFRPFETGARNANLKFVDGLSMLIGQAEPAFESLFDTIVPTRVDADLILRKALKHAAL
ncbi:MAG: shikimate dehydrogenase (NADP(+)) [Hyphobacterium sp.]|nr:MAG: shikimate dehydrogenase (NADP(+)) [Hyphobacterium sp.]